jgi:hypothetical protein
MVTSAGSCGRSGSAIADEHNSTATNNLLIVWGFRVAFMDVIQPEN